MRWAWVIGLGVFWLSMPASPVDAADVTAGLPGTGVLLAAVDHPAGEEDAAHPEGVPLDPKKDLALWSLIVFVVFLLVLQKLAWKPLIGGLDKRESRLMHQLAEAEAKHHRAETLLAERMQQLEKAQEEVRAIVEEGRRDGEVARQNKITEGQQEADARRNRALEDIERAKEQALKEIFDVVSRQVTYATRHVLERNLDEADHERLVNEALTEFSAANAQHH